MYGISIFLGESLTEQTEAYIDEMNRLGIKGIFTSLHIPEDDATLYAARLRQLGQIAHQRKMKLMVDISGEALMRAGFAFDDLDSILAIGVTGLRMDYAISNKKIAEASQKIDIGLNASTITPEDVVELKKYGADFNRFEAWHNYYPRPETGLSSIFFATKNSWLKEAGFKIFAFVPGNGVLRGPIYQGLPTLEKHRYLNPLACMLDLESNFGVDGIYIGDPTISTRSRNQISTYLKTNTFVLEVNNTGSKYFNLILGDHANRQDDARDVIRSAEARFKKIDIISPEKALERHLGSVTIDNEKYGRYMGEIQILKNNLPCDDKVNIAAKVVAEDLSLIDYIKPGDKFKLIEKGML
ncbi:MULTISPECIES: MupG family TIM beta-alpha barrel fold protein [unclassified Enterococcus]|uniref:DUF871 domain-containing protein n=1 Tax=unclassified Enterococcus TaxID=2608891 RepID=UPI001554288C|nr:MULTISPECIES: MupG family TIM beta-alpha barrel fold protein [unclassified Enterococcus]MBS7577783.1 DUF871 domain-containing protein [Enterococcus sp. MMGLQ5-2]MBS7585043.1 DUF871 domain-containing protein [Enterococcus sp. MMGLQ5-1]NPD12899.1 DUF871 domain-containing protein [Enterococcus sp. MMGLQ5-1]NPD37613.1 DUF871 domain-containing protein [Enterococcus sp. MMGLQ5-2]